jgi:hypothetical protein
MKLRCTNPTLPLYVAWVYALPATLNVWLNYESDIYVNPSNGWATWLYAGLLFFITVAFAFRIEWRESLRPAPAPLLWQVPVKPMVWILAGVLTVASLGAASGLSRWRYAEEGLSGSLDLMSLLFVIAPNVLELILFALLFFRYRISLRAMRVMMVLLTVDLALTASGIGPMLGVLLALTSAIAPETARRILLKPDQVTASTPKLRRLIWMLPLIGSLGVLAYLAGDAVKKDVSLTEVLDTQDASDVFLRYLVGRISVQWYSLVAALHQMVELGVGDPMHNLLAPITNAGFRFSSLTGGWLGIERPLDGSLARVNYGLINLYPFNDREGTTPGLIATVVLTCPFWLGPVALAVYLWIYDKIQAGIRRRFAGRPTLAGELLLLYFTAIFFSSPADFLLVFDPMLLTLVAWCYLGLSAKPERLSHAAIQPSH